MRKCGSCNLCCTLLYVPELNKLPESKCVHCTTKCTIYEQRPTSCKTFSCGWLSGDMEAEMRPDKIGVLIEKMPAEKLVLALSVDHAQKIPEQVIKFYHKKDTAIVARQKRIYAPEGTSEEDVMKRLQVSMQVMGV